MRSEGVSMYPLLHPGDVIEFEKCNANQVAINDIVLLYSQEKFITHRVIYYSNNVLVTRGDNNPTEDIGIGKEHIIGRAVRFKRKGKWYLIDEVYSNQSLTYIKEIARVSRYLQIKQIPHVYIKGLVASLKFLKRFPQRIYSDIDLLIQRRDIYRVNDAFLTLSYRRYDDRWLSMFSPAPLDKRYEVDFIKKVGSIPVVFDVHLEPVFLMIKMSGMDLLYRDNLRAELGSHFITEAKSFTILGQKIPVCSAPDQVLYLLLHIFHNNFTDSIRFQLVDRVIRGTMQADNWKRFYNTVARFQLEGYIYPSLRILVQYFNTPIPRSILKKLKPKHILARMVSQYVIHKTNIFRSPTRIKGGIIRFVLSILLSPEPMYRKILVLFHPKTLISVVWLAVKKLQTMMFRRKIERSI